VRIRFIGRRDMLPKDVLEAVDRMEAMTAGNKKYVLILNSNGRGTNKDGPRGVADG
jgi:undecaprenyl pyrophosphate synthase